MQPNGPDSSLPPARPWNVPHPLDRPEPHPLDRPDFPGGAYAPGGAYSSGGAYAPYDPKAPSGKKKGFSVRSLLQYSLNTLLLVMILAAVLFGVIQQRIRFGDPLPVRTEGVTNGLFPATFRFKAEGPGLLTVAARAKYGEDLVIDVKSDGLALTDGHLDVDYDGDRGAEQGAIVIPSKGDYTVTVSPLGGGPQLAEYTLVTAFIPFAAAAGPQALGLSDATVLTLGKTIPGAILPRRHGTLFRFTPQASGAVTISTGNSSADIVLTAYRNDLHSQIGRSDQDLGGNTGNEAITLNAVPGNTYYVMVTPFGGRTTSGINFQIAAKAGTTIIATPGVPFAGPPGIPAPVPFLPGPFMPAPLPPVPVDPAKARVVTLDEVVRGSIPNPNDHELFVFFPPQDGVVKIRTFQSTGDVVLTALRRDETTQLQPSDQDLNGDRGNEEIVLTVQQGEAYYFLVTPWSQAYTPNFALDVRWQGTPRPAREDVGPAHLPGRNLPGAVIPGAGKGQPPRKTSPAPPQVEAARLKIDEARRASVVPSKGYVVLEFTAPQTGDLRVWTTRSTGDLVLSAFEGNLQTTELQTSDQDLNGDLGAEEVRLRVEEGKRYLFRVRPFGNAGAPAFDIEAAWIGTPDPPADTAPFSPPRRPVPKSVPSPHH